MISKMKKSGVQDESLWHVLYDLFSNLKCCSQVLMFGLSIVLSYLAIHYKLDKCSSGFENLTEKYITVFSCTLGLSIAVYAIIIGFHTESLIRLLSNDNTNRKPFHVVCASIIFNGLVQITTLLTAFSYLFIGCPCIFFIATFLSCYSLFQIVDILFQLLGLRTFIVGVEIQDFHEDKTFEDCIDELTKSVKELTRAISNGRNGQ